MKTVKLTKEKLKLFIKEELEKLEELGDMEEADQNLSREETAQAQAALDDLEQKIAALQQQKQALLFAVQDNDRARLAQIMSSISGNQ